MSVAGNPSLDGSHPIGISRLLGPRLPVLGQRVNLLRFMADPIGFMVATQARYGNLASLVSGRKPHVFAFGASANETVLGDTRLFHNLSAADIPLRIPPGSALARLFTGLIQMNGARHEQQRRLLARAFRETVVATYGALVADEVKRHLSTWRVGQRRDLAEEMSTLTLAVACRLLVGPGSAADGRLQGLFRQWTRLVFSPWSALLPYDLPGLSYRRLTAVSQELEGVVRAMIARRRAATARGQSLLDALVEARDGDVALEEDELVGQVNFLLMAGHATTASALTWTLFLLDRHPDIRNAVRDELVALPPALSSSEGGTSTLLDRVIKESLRLLPPVLWWCKIATASFRIGDVSFAPGTRVIQSPFVTQRDPAVFPDPHRFVPDRWLGGHRSPWEYCPFSAGGRRCLGSSLALLEIRTIVAHIIRAFDVEVVGPRVRGAGPMILAPRGGMPCDLVPPSAKGKSARRPIDCALVDLGVRS